MTTDFLSTPLGILEICASQHGISHVTFTEKKYLGSVSHSHTIVNDCIVNDCKQQLKEYFAGQRKIFTLPLDPQGTEFQKRVWQSLLDIPYGQAASYLHIAKTINNPKAVRAVGAANGKNPISIIVPCHRIIGSNKKLTGYAGGLDRKSWLLKHEGILFDG